MSRTGVYTYEEFSTERTVVGWFDPERAKAVYYQGKDWDGSNMIGTITSAPVEFVDTWLYLTAGGRWVEYRNASRYFNGAITFEYLTDDEARDWLLRSEANDEAIEEHFGEIPEEVGPGRPEIGPAFSVRFPAELVTRVDAASASAGVSRAGWLRQVAQDALA